MEFARALRIAQKHTSDQYPLVRVKAVRPKLGLGHQPFVQISATNSFSLVDIRLKGMYGTGTIYVDRWTQAPMRGIRDVTLEDDKVVMAYHGGTLRLSSEADGLWGKAVDTMLEQEIPPRTIDSSFSPKLLGKLLTDMASFGNYAVMTRQLGENKPMRLEQHWDEGDFTGLLMPMRTLKRDANDSESFA